MHVLWRMAGARRRLSISVPYMHDGKFEAIKDVFEFYNRGRETHKEVKLRIKPLGLYFPTLIEKIKEDRSQVPDIY